MTDQTPPSAAPIEAENVVVPFSSISIVRHGPATLKMNDLVVNDVTIRCRQNDGGPATVLEIRPDEQGSGLLVIDHGEEGRAVRSSVSGIAIVSS